MAPRQSFVITLGTGMIFGYVFFYILDSTFNNHPNLKFIGPNNDLRDESAGPDNSVHMHSFLEEHHDGDSKEADRLFNEVRVLCWITTNPKSHDKKAKHVKATWGRRCNKFLIISSAEDEFLETIALNVSEGRDFLWGKTKEAFKYIYKNHRNEADWFLKADDDTYVIVENLRYMLSSYNSEEPIFFGCRYKKFMSGGSGYVLSKESLRRFIEDAIPSWLKCQSSDVGDEDVEIAKCLKNVGVKPTDSRDHLGRGRFLPLALERHLIPGFIEPQSWFWKFTYYPVYLGMECCSDTAISFHYVTPGKMYELEYYIYHLRPFGIKPMTQFPPPLPPDKSWISQEVLEKYANISEENTTTFSSYG